MIKITNTFYYICTLGISQVVRHRVLVPTCGGSNPSFSVKFDNLIECYQANKHITSNLEELTKVCLFIHHSSVGRASDC